MSSASGGGGGLRGPDLADDAPRGRKPDHTSLPTDVPPPPPLPAERHAGRRLPRALRRRPPSKKSTQSKRSARSKRSAQSGPAGLRRPLRRRRGPFWGLLRWPKALGVVIVVLVIALVTGLTGAFLWARSDSNQLRRSTPPTPTLDRSRADQSGSGQDEPTSTTRPDLSAEALAKKEGPSVLTVNTLNSAGQPVQGTAFVAATPGGQTLLLTSLSVVEASTRQPAPDITLKGDRYNGPATLWTWDPGHDLALLVVGRTNAPALPWAADTGATKVGDKLFVVAGGGQVRPGVVTALSDATVQHNVFVDDNLRGAPLVNVKGEVLGMASAAYTAGGTPTDTAFFGVPLVAACAVVLHCGGNGPAASPDAGSGPTASTTPTTPTTRTTPTTIARSGPSTTRRP